MHHMVVWGAHPPRVLLDALASSLCVPNLPVRLCFSRGRGKRHPPQCYGGRARARAVPAWMVRKARSKASTWVRDGGFGH